MCEIGRIVEVHENEPRPEPMKRFVKPSRITMIEIPQRELVPVPARRKKAACSKAIELGR
jgi:hypothetical protein